MISVRNNLGRAVQLVNLLAEIAAAAQPDLPRLISANASSPQQFEPFLCRDTYVCSRWTFYAAHDGGYRRGLVHQLPSVLRPVCSTERPATDDPGTHAAKKGPVYYVDSAKVREEKARQSKSGQRASNGSCQDASVPVISHKHSHKTYLLSQVTQEQMAMIPSAKGMACV
jgi:hypothetical protein